MNIRRYLNLYFHEGDREETRRFFFDEGLSHLSSEKIFRVIEIELKFMYDAVFSKSRGTTYDKQGTIMRIVNIPLLGFDGYTVYSGLIGR
ncbi:hypothetical protein SUGI_0507630 [Cryptomeria japonica]|nr:hypothetical protein SUGI_0507630 [Cryptomeria japonica]